MRDGWVTWVKIKDMPKCLSPVELIQKPKFKARANDVRKKREGKIQAVTPGAVPGQDGETPRPTSLESLGAREDQDLCMAAAPGSALV